MRCARPADTALTANSCPTDMISLPAVERVSVSEISAILLPFTLLALVARFDLSSSVCIDNSKLAGACDYSSVRDNRLLESS